MTYGSLQCLAGMISMIVLNLSINNLELKNLYNIRNIIIIVGFGFLFVIFFGLSMVFVCDSEL
jgi:hypothetical protein